uniref:Uncharacterized protein n=1 Tax=Chenopodium quinoa TaxID=63459 RepID=A0A803KXP9_CHEQI
MSIDALAMAGVDYKESGINFREMEFRDMESIPKYLLAENEFGNKKDEKKRVVAAMLQPDRKQNNAKIQPWRKVSTTRSSG